MLIRLSEILEQFSARPKHVVHVGAHHGEELNEYVQNGLERITLFEPLAAHCEVIRSKIANYPAELFQVALGATEQRDVKIFLASNGQSSSVLAPKEHLELHPYVGFSGFELVEQRTLDSYGLSPDMLNMDVQGYELEVLKGATQTLASVKLVVTEVNSTEVYENCARIEQLDAFLADYGLARVRTEWACAAWGDAVYVREGV